jgi:hypothetical protein
MDKVINTLTLRLGEHLSLSKARLECLAALVLALLAGESVNLRKVSLRMHGAAEPESQYRKLQRFFPQCAI